MGCKKKSYKKTLRNSLTLAGKWWHWSLTRVRAEGPRYLKLRKLSDPHTFDGPLNIKELFVHVMNANHKISVGFGKTVKRNIIFKLMVPSCTVELLM